MRFHIVYAVWGDDYIDLFEKAALPNTLSQLDRLAAPDRASFSCKVYTTERDARRLAESKVFSALSRTIAVEILPIDDLAGGKYGRMAECHRRALSAALRDEAAIIFLPPDTFLSDGAFSVLRTHARNGIRVVLLPSLRVTTESMLPILVARFLSPDGLRLAIPPRELMGVAIKHLHGFTRALIVNSGAFDGRWPSHLDWKVGEEGLLAHCFHLHPLLVDPAGLKALPESSLDDDLISRLPLAAGQSRVVTDSDEILMCELCPQAVGPEPGFSRPASLFRIAAWAANHTRPDHRRYYRERIYLHAGERSARWAAVERESDRAVRVIALLLLIRPLLFDVRAYLSRIGVLRRVYFALKPGPR